jgi:hypothetical protein
MHNLDIIIMVIIKGTIWGENQQQRRGRMERVRGVEYDQNTYAHIYP